MNIKRRFICSVAVAVSLCAAALSDAGAWENEEHRLLGDSVWFSVMRECGKLSGDSAFIIGEAAYGFAVRHHVFVGKTFGDLCAEFAKKDLSRTRFHERGRTILQQLQSLKPAEIDTAWQHLTEPRMIRTPGRLAIAELSPTLAQRNQNVVVSYLIRHLLALKLAERAAQSDDIYDWPLMVAIAMEAQAQGYLADAFSAGHMLVPLSDPLASLHPRNNIEAHNYHRNQGAYVINSRGNVWQTFGDKLMHWYAPTYRPVLEACRYSLMELLVVFFHSSPLKMPTTLNSWLHSAAQDQPVEQVISAWLESKDGDEYYVTDRMPTLMLLPMPVAASWSFRTNAIDTHGICRRYHYSQLREEGLHDPDLDGIDEKFLYPRTSMPDWMVPEPFRREPAATPDELIRSHPDWASVRWTQIRYAPPSYKGILLHLGGQLTFNGGDSQLASMVGIGYGFWDDLIIVKNVSASLSLLPSVNEPQRTLLVPTAGFGLAFSPIECLKALHAETGLAIGLNTEYDDVGSVFAVGLDSRVLPLGFTNAGVTCRLKYQWFCFDPTLHGPSLELIFQ